MALNARSATTDPNLMLSPQFSCQGPGGSQGPLLLSPRRNLSPTICVSRLAEARQRNQGDVLVKSGEIRDADRDQRVNAVLQHGRYDNRVMCLLGAAGNSSREVE